jgi:hypothetical protein
MRHKFTVYAILLLGLILVVSLASCASKPEPVLQWSRTFGGEGGFLGDLGRSVQQTTDGGYIVCGSTESYTAGDEDIWLVKTDADGNKLWDKTFGGNGFNAGRSVQQTTDGGYIVCGYRDPYADGNGHAWLIKTDVDGNKLWDRTFGSEVSTIATSVQQTMDGGYVICGKAGPYETGKTETLLIKTDATGNQLFEKVFAGEGLDMGNSVHQTGDGGYIICGMAGSYEMMTAGVSLIKTDSNGNKLWGRTFGGEGGGIGNSVQQTTDGGYIVCGTKTSYETNKIKQGVWLIKTNAKGNKLWDKTFEDERFAQGESVQQTTDGGYIICGTVSVEGSKHVLLLKIAPEQ